MQRLTAHVSGKAQKYARIGPREFVSFDEDLDMTIANIISACERHFTPKLGKDVVCDVLAGEQGPFCSSINQLPDMKVILLFCLLFRYLVSPSLRARVQKWLLLLSLP